MTKFKLYAVAAVISGLSLSGCGGDASQSDSTTDGGAGSANRAANWNAADACSILDKAEAATLLKQEIKETQLGMVHEAGTSDAATSECTYIGTDGGSVASLMTRWSPIDDNTPATIDGTRNAAASALKAFSDKPLEDVPGLGKSAFFTPAINSLTMFIDDARMVTVNVHKVPDGENGKDIAVALAKEAAG